MHPASWGKRAGCGQKLWLHPFHNNNYEHFSARYCQESKSFSGPSCFAMVLVLRRHKILFFQNFFFHFKLNCWEGHSQRQSPPTPPFISPPSIVALLLWLGDAARMRDPAVSLWTSVQNETAIWHPVLQLWTQHIWGSPAKLMEALWRWEAGQSTDRPNTDK